MKTIGRTPTGGAVLEASGTEIRILNLLAQVTDGKLLDELWHPSEVSVLDYDFTDGLQAVYAWVLVKDKANELRDIATQIENALKEKK
jgi:hypothetical protein